MPGSFEFRRNYYDAELRVRWEPDEGDDALGVLAELVFSRFVCMNGRPDATEVNGEISIQ